MKQKQIRGLIYFFIITLFIGVFFGMCIEYNEPPHKQTAVRMNNKFIPQITKPEPQHGKLFERPMDTVEVKKYSWESFSPLLNENANVKLKK